MHPAQSPLSSSLLFRYGLLGFPLAFAALPVYVMVPQLYGQTLGLPLGIVGAILLATRAGDAFFDPLVGAWADQHRTRLMVLGAVALAVGIALLFNPPRSMPQEALPAWLCASLLITYAGYSMLSIPYQAWGATLVSAQTSDVERERARVTAWREGLGLGGIVVAALLPNLLAPLMGPYFTPINLLGFISAVLVCAATALVLLTVKQAAPSTATPSLPLAASPRQSWLAPWQQDRAFRALLAVFALNGIASAVPATLVLFFVGDVLRLPQHEGTFLAAYFVCGALGMPVWIRLAGRFGAANAWGGAMWLAVAVFAWAALLGAGDFVPFLIICALSGLALGADLALAPALLAGVIAQAGASGREGPYFGLWNFVTKANLALAAGISLPLLAWAGYVPSTNGASLASKPLALIAAYCALPCVLKLIAFVLLRRHAAPLLPSSTLPHA